MSLCDLAGKSVAVALALIVGAAAYGDEASARRWVERMLFTPPQVDTDGICPGQIGALPGFDVTPDAAGMRLVRIPLPFAPGTLPASLGVTVSCEGTELTPDLRVLTLHPGKPTSVRRAMLTFPFEFKAVRPYHFKLALSDAPDADSTSAACSDGACAVDFAGAQLSVSSDGFTLTHKDGSKWTATLIAPKRATTQTPVPELVEAGKYYLWLRVLVPDDEWPRMLEVQVDALGGVAVQAHLQRLGASDATAPDLGWEIHGPQIAPIAEHKFSEGTPVTLHTQDAVHEITFPVAPYDRRGFVSVANADQSSTVKFLRCAASDNTPFQQASWRRAAFVLAPSGSAPRSFLLEPALTWKTDAQIFGSIYELGANPDLSMWPVLNDLRHYTADAIKQSVVLGDDFGNVTAFNPGAPAPAFGMNRLNHCPAIFQEAWRSRDASLRDVAVNWCSNMYDLSIWWGDTESYGGTRYNNVAAMDQPSHKDDQKYMWRSNGDSNFCTKGYDSFFYAYEETGDPRMLVALNAQVAYARKNVHTDKGECRNIGDVSDFINLYRHTGTKMYRDEALRLFQELRGKLSTGDLFSQGGQPIVEDTPFIDDDAHGYKAPFAKPYIIGYALNGLPALLELCPDEPKLRDVVRAVADFMANSQDPVGGWRYPHPRSSGLIISQAMEHAMQLSRAAAVLEKRGENIEKQLDAIERVLQARLLGFARNGQILAGLSGWEAGAGALKDGKTIYDLYAKATDRDPARDYTEGPVSAGGAPPEGLVHFGETLRFYLAHRPAERLMRSNGPLASVLARLDDRRLKLTPQPAGAFLRIARPENKDAAVTLWAPQWISFPKLGSTPEELGGLKLEWKSDLDTGAVWYAVDRPEASLTATFTPHVDYVECAYTVWPKPGQSVPSTLAVGPCQQLKQSLFDGPDAELASRISFVAGGAWTNLAACANGVSRPILYIKGPEAPEMNSPMTEGGWKTVATPKPDTALIVCASKDGQWVTGTAAEHTGSLCSDTEAAFRCMHSQSVAPLRKDGPTTIRTNVYLMRGKTDDVKTRYASDALCWKGQTSAPAMGERQAATFGMRAGLPSDHENRLARMDFPLAWSPRNNSFDAWRTRAREAYLKSLSSQPVKAPFALQVVGVEDRGSYTAKKIAFNISADNRIGAYLLVPKGNGPFPAMLALHDHGAHFSIGKEKVVRPFAVSDERAKDALDWVTAYYSGKWIGDELAQRGYVVLAIDALFWGDRGRAEGVKYEAQEQLSVNMLQFGATWAGTIVWDDLRSAEFLQGLSEVIPGRIGCVGLSMGSNRTWSLAAATDIIKAGAAICWMGDSATLMGEGNNQTTGQSSASMTHPGLRNLLDYPDVASIACPKPMLFFNGSEDKLFPISGVEASYQRMRRVWKAQSANDNLVTKIWPVPHLFNADMQKEAFDWLDKQLKP